MVVLLVTAGSSNNDAPNLDTFYGPNRKMHAKILLGTTAQLTTVFYCDQKHQLNITNGSCWLANFDKV